MTARDLSNRLAELLRQERHAMADFLLALAEFDRAAAYRELGHASLFSFLRRELRLSAGAAQYRKTAAELIQRFPQVERALRSGELCLSSIAELAKVVTPENVAEVLPRFFGLSRREAADVAVSIRPVESPAAREVVTAVRAAPRSIDAPVTLALPPAPERQVRPAELPSSQEAGSTEPRQVELAAVSMTTPRAPAPTPSTVEPLDAERVRLHLTVSRRLLAKLEAAKDALSHAKPGAASEEVLEAALDLLLAQRAKRKGLVEKPGEARVSSPEASTTSSERVPAAVRREAWKRSGGRCEYRFASGERCDSTVRLELDHIVPRALGGPSTLGNVRVCCCAHNRLEARRIFGDEVADRYTRRRRSGGAPERGDSAS